MTTETSTIDALDFPAPPYAVADEVADLLFREARTVGAFTDEPVSDEELAAVYDLLKWGPTAMNTTPMRLLVVRSGDAKARLAAHAAEGNRDRILAAPLTLVVAADPGFHRHMPVLAPHLTALADALEDQDEQRSTIARTNTLIQTGYLITALRATGLDAGPMGGIDTAGIDAEFFAESGWQSQLVVLVGHRDGVGTAYPRAPRLTWADVSTTA